jgi:NAD(P) transhydrogenase beta subunit
VTSDPTLATLALTTGVLSSGALGLHMTSSIGGADMPVVVTLLNSYSGWVRYFYAILFAQSVYIHPIPSASTYPNHSSFHIDRLCALKDSSSTSHS